MLPHGEGASSPAEVASRWPQPAGHDIPTHGSGAGSFSSTESGPSVAGASRPSAPGTQVSFCKAGPAPLADVHGPGSDTSHLAGQGWGLQISTATAGCWAPAVHRAGGNVFRRLPWASTQRTGRSRRPPPQETLHGPKSPTVQYGGQGSSMQASGHAGGCWLPWHRAVSTNSFLAWSRQL